jgi:hypothetical protein
MTAMEVSYCVLILSGAFALIALGILFLRSSISIKQLGNTAEMAQETLEKVDRVIDDANYKLDLLNAPVESIAHFFNPKRPRFSLVSVILRMFKK